MAELVGVVAAAAQLATACLSLLDATRKIKAAPATLQKYQTQLENIQNISITITENPLLQTLEVESQTKSILALVEESSLSLSARTGRLSQFWTLFRQERSLLENLNTLERHKTSLLLVIDSIQASTLQRIHVDINTMADKKTTTPTSESPASVEGHPFGIPSNDSLTLITANPPPGVNPWVSISQHPGPPRDSNFWFDPAQFGTEQAIRSYEPWTDDGSEAIIGHVVKVDPGCEDMLSSMKLPHPVVVSGATTVGRGLMLNGILVESSGKLGQFTMPGANVMSFMPRLHSIKSELSIIECDMKKCEHGFALSSANTVSCCLLIGMSVCSTGMFGSEWINSRCIMCDSPSKIRCDDCRVANFRHPRNGFKDSDRPTANHVRILTLPPSGTKGPVFGWARRIKTSDGTWALESEDPDLVAWHTRNPKNHTTQLINLALGLPPLGHGLHAHWVPWELEKQEDATCTEAHGIQAKYGFIFAMSPDGGPGNDERVLDVTFRDARHVVDFLLEGGTYPIIPDPRRFALMNPTAIVVPAIKTNSPFELINIVLGIKHDQSIEEIHISLRQPADYRPIFAACRLGLRYWTRLATLPETYHNRIVYSTGFHMYGGEFAHNLEVHRNTSDSDTPGPFTYVNTERNITSTILLHGSGAKIEKTHFWAVVSFLREGQLREDAINEGKTHEWPAWVVEALGPDHGAKLKHGKPDKEAFHVYWDIWKVHVGQPDMESPWDFEERHKNEAVFMSPEGTWPSMGVATPDYCSYTAAANALRDIDAHARAVGHINDARAADEAAYNNGRPMVFSEPTDENRWMDDLGQTSMNDMVGRFKTVCPRGPTRPRYNPGEKHFLRLDPPAENDHRPLGTETPGDVEYMPHADGPPDKSAVLVDMFRGTFTNLHKEYCLNRFGGGPIPPMTDDFIRGAMSIPADTEELSEQLRKMTMGLSKK
ncbi:hypothetical protein F5X68DRAFT_243711 [Plectosphaerella plurivora]|uniref:Uncharacterized protein n=1 Tax=Plectosphaerella plurivora TaxID=936078 RepID=A0A9P9AEL0_9PEZI|nr:hypothetical protein F5X68DRAFT_243711 [Plectosphaerella plurivora]